jgi:hypothetical protein
MALGIKHSEVKRRFGRARWMQLHGRGIDHKSENWLLERFGLAKDHDYRHLFPQVHLANTAFLRHLLWGRRAIVSVTSKNNRDGMHAIYWDGKALFDPSPKKTYLWEEVEPVELLIFNERP